ncbi:HAD-IA family hydrolase [Streptomyces sp. NPDC046261]|uniref:HAD-IA family hydrolase n=1 Tax=Streptomyces sp. NPDC046261 TaxID=3157200 RepID=UPI0033EC7CFC
MAVKGCMFDFSSTLFHLEDAESWLRAVATDAGLSVGEDEVRLWAGRLLDFGAVPGGPAPRYAGPELTRLWQERDLDVVRHRAAYTGLLRAAGLPWPELIDALYERHMTAPAWQPYPDTREVLDALRRNGVGVVVVSNIGYDLRPIFRHHAMDTYVDAYVLSFEHEIQKPDPRLFEIAYDHLGLRGADVAMIGDDRVADAGAAALGSPVHFVDPLPVTERPDALRALLPHLL